MGDESPNIIQVIYRNIFGKGKSSAVTNTNNEIILKSVKMHILEMEDVLFHLNSAVMMPENPQGKSSTQGGGASEEQKSISGLKALAIVFKQFEFDPNQRLIITGHTDTSGTFDFNFKLSDERAMNILYLLDGNKEEWANICYNRHKVEDYQQIMKYFETKLACGCDPGDIDDKWGDKTRKASYNFFHKMVPDQADYLINKTESDFKKRWPVEAWHPVYDLYSKEIAEALSITNAKLESYRKSSIRYVSDNSRYVGCGESFPIDSKEKSNYRSQKNRRVELLFFDIDECPEINCPSVINRAHTEEECPLWRKFYFIPLYIDPNDLNCIVYHLQFVYYDKIKTEAYPVPAGLSINVYENGHKKLPSQTMFKDGRYFVKVDFGNKLKDPARTELYFEFESLDKWIYTKDDKTDPEIVYKSWADFEKLSFKDKQHYYDLPKFWSSRNYWVKQPGEKWEIYEKIFKNTFKLKPFGNEITNPNNKLLEFWFEDIVLTDSTRNQILRDQNAAGTQIPLNENSRYSLFHIDHKAEENVDGSLKKLNRLIIYKPEEDQPVFTDFKFKKNIIFDVPIFTRIIYFCNDFYDIEYKRTSPTDPGFDYSKGHVAGARLAMKNDPNVHGHKPVIATDSNDIARTYALDNCGHYEMHYFHNCTLLDDKPLSYLFIYWSCRFVQNTTNHSGQTLPPSSAAEVSKHRKEGMKYSMDRLNKNYLIEKNDGSEDIYIRIFHFMEAKNNTNGGQHKAEVNIIGNNPDRGAWMRLFDSQLRARDCAPDPKYFGNSDPVNNLADTDGSKYAVLTNHHEMGHATGNWDDYLYDFQDSSKNNWSSLPRYDQPFTAIGGPYTCDELSRMNSNRTPRLRNFWKFVLWLNDESPSGKTLNKFLKGTNFKITFKGTSHKHEFFLADQYRNVEVACKSKTDHEIDGDRKVDLLLYKLGDDELSRMIDSRQIFNAILVIKIRLALKFVNGTHSWNFANSLAWAQQLNNDFKSMFEKKFRITTNTNNNFKNIYVVITPSYQVFTGWFHPSDSQFDIEVKRQTGGNFDTSDDDIEVDFDTNKNRIIRYIFGKTTGTGNLTNTDFPTIVNWVGSSEVCNASYNMHNI
jgi:hypothetical protein